MLLRSFKLWTIAAFMLLNAWANAQGKSEKGLFFEASSTGLHGGTPAEGDTTGLYNILFPNQLGQNRIGYNVGFYAVKKLNKKLSYQFELLYSRRGIYNQFEKLNANNDYLSTSQLLRFTPLPKFSFLAGFEASYLLSQENWGELDILTYDLSPVLGLSYGLSIDGLSLSGKVSQGLFGVANVSLLGNDRSYYHRSISFGVYYEPFVNMRLYKSQPPILAVKDVKFSDQDNTINANEVSYVSFVLANQGQSIANKVQAVLAVSGDNDGIELPKKMDIKKLKPGEEEIVKIPIISTRKTKNGNLLLSIDVIEPNGFNPPNSPIQMIIPTKEFKAPMIEVVDFKAPKKWAPGTIMHVDLLVQNTGQGAAKDVAINMISPKNVYQDPVGEIVIKEMMPGESKLLTYSFMVPSQYDQNDIKLEAKLNESFSEYYRNWKEVFVFDKPENNEQITLTPQEVNEIRIQKAAMSKNITFNKFERDVPVTRIFVVGTPNEDCTGNINDSQDAANLAESTLLGKYDILERRLWEQILNEQKLGISGIIREETAVELGCNIGSEGIIFIEVGCVDEEETITVKLVGCQTSAIYWSCVAVDASIVEVFERIKMELGL